MPDSDPGGPNLAGPRRTGAAPEPGSSSLVTQDKQENVLKTNLEGNLTLEGVQRGQSGTYGCRVEDYDAAEDAVLSKTAELRVACERPGRMGRGALAPAASSSSSHSPAANPFSPFLWSFLVCDGPLRPQGPTPAPSSLPQEAARELIPKHKPDCPLLRTCHGSPVPLGESPCDPSRPSRPTWGLHLCLMLLPTQAFFSSQPSSSPHV